MLINFCISAAETFQRFLIISMKWHNNKCFKIVTMLTTQADRQTNGMAKSRPIVIMSEFSKRATLQYSYQLIATSTLPHDTY